MNTSFATGAFCALLLLTSSRTPSVAQELHSDIEFTYRDGRIQIEPGAEGFVFEGEFGVGSFANQASEPGFESESDEGLGIGAQDVIGFNVLTELRYWNGTQFASPGSAAITVPGIGGSEDTVISPTTDVVLANFTIPRNLIGQADGDGNLHTDRTFLISDGAPAGGYGLTLSLATNAEGINDSRPFGIFLNFGQLDEAQFEAGVAAFAASVPEPRGLMPFALAALTGVAIRRRRRTS